MRKFLMMGVVALGLTACEYTVYNEPYHQPISTVVTVSPQYTYVAVGHPYAYFRHQVTGYRIVYVRNGVYHTTYSKTPYGVGDIFYN